MTHCQSTEFELSFKTVDFANMLAGVIAIFDAKTKEKGVDMNAEVSNEAQVIKTDIQLFGSNRSLSIF